MPPSAMASISFCKSVNEPVPAGSLKIISHVKDGDKRLLFSCNWVSDVVIVFILLFVSEESLESVKTTLERPLSEILSEFMVVSSTISV